MALDCLSVITFTMAPRAPCVASLDRAMIWKQPALETARPSDIAILPLLQDPRQTCERWRARTRHGDSLPSLASNGQSEIDRYDTKPAVVFVPSQPSSTRRHLHVCCMEAG